MPKQEIVRRAKKDEREGKAPTTQAGQFVREEIDHVRQGKQGARSSKQAIAIGLSKARKSGVQLPPPKKAAPKKPRAAVRAATGGRSSPKRAPSPKRSRATKKALQPEGTQAASTRALSRQGGEAARRRKKPTTPRRRTKQEPE